MLSGDFPNSCLQFGILKFVTMTTKAKCQECSEKGEKRVTAFLWASFLYYSYSHYGVFMENFWTSNKVKHNNHVQKMRFL